MTGGRKCICSRLPHRAHLKMFVRVRSFSTLRASSCCVNSSSSFVECRQCAFVLALDRERHLCFCVCVHLRETGKPSVHAMIFSLCATLQCYTPKLFCVSARANTDERACQSALMWLWLEAGMRRFGLLSLERHNNQRLPPR